MNPANLEALDMRSAAEIARAQARQAARQALRMGDKEARSALRGAMRTPEGQAANHNIPWQMRDNPLVKKAAEGGWNINGASNGSNLPNTLHSGWKNWHAWHKYYNELADRMLSKALTKNPNMTAEEAAQAAQKIADSLAKYAKSVCGQ